MANDDSLIFQISATLVVVVLMVPGLVIEPGPLSEVAGMAALASIWGFNWG